MSEVRLSAAERQPLVAAEHMTQSGCACEPIRDAVEAILTDRLAAVEALMETTATGLGALRTDYADGWRAASDIMLGDIRAALTDSPDGEPGGES